jgi:tetratricopeptide (TPR) repeat protein
LYYTIGEFQRSLHDCRKVIAMIPHHFGALHGMGLCYAAIGEYEAAIQSFRRTLELQPHSLINKKLILECTVML